MDLVGLRLAALVGDDGIIGYLKEACTDDEDGDTMKMEIGVDGFGVVGNID